MCRVVTSSTVSDNKNNEPVKLNCISGSLPTFGLDFFMFSAVSHCSVSISNLICARSVTLSCFKEEN